MVYYFMTFAASVLLAGSFACQKCYQKLCGATAQAGFFFNALMGLFGTVLFLFVTGFRPAFTGYSVLMALIYSTLVFVYNILGMKVMRDGSVSLYTMFLMAGGMSVPYVWGLLFLGEEFSWLRMVGLVLILVAVVITAGKIKVVGYKTLLLCILIFVMNGFVSVTSKVHMSQTVYPAVGAMDFAFWNSLCKFVPCMIAYFVIMTGNRGAASKVENLGKGVLWILGGSVVANISAALQLVGAECLPASVLYPIITGGSVIVTAFAAWIFFEEKPDKRTWLGIAICFAGTLLFL